MTRAVIVKNITLNISPHRPALYGGVPGSAGWLQQDHTDPRCVEDSSCGCEGQLELQLQSKCCIYKECVGGFLYFSQCFYGETCLYLHTCTCNHSNPGCTSVLFEYLHANPTSVFLSAEESSTPTCARFRGESDPHVRGEGGGGTDRLTDKAGASGPAVEPQKGPDPCPAPVAAGGDGTQEPALNPELLWKASAGEEAPVGPGGDPAGALILSTVAKGLLVSGIIQQHGRSR